MGRCLYAWICYGSVFCVLPNASQFYKLSHIVLFTWGLRVTQQHVSFITKRKNPVHATPEHLQSSLRKSYTRYGQHCVFKKNPSFHYYGVWLVCLTVRPHGNTGSCLGAKPRAWYSVEYSLRSLHINANHVLARGYERIIWRLGAITPTDRWNPYLNPLIAYYSYSGITARRHCITDGGTRNLKDHVATYFFNRSTKANT